jgi:signal transduction histidine kinase
MSTVSKQNNQSSKKGVERTSLNPAAAGHHYRGEIPDTNIMLSRLSHDLRSPLNTVIGFSEVLLSSRIGKLNSGQKKQLNIIHKRANELLDVLDDIVEYCKIMSHESELCLSTLSVNSVVNITVERLKTRLTDDSPMLTYEGVETRLRARGEERALTRLLEHIVLDGAELLKPRDIEITVEDAPGVIEVIQGPALTIFIRFSGPNTFDPGTILDWTTESEIPGHIRFNIYLARFYISLMGGELMMIRKKGCMEFLLHLCKVQL